ncbi:MAG: hypothetical protein IPM68_11445 [Flavobacteriales bacterium]|nr:hypothetical protein [Flavobacteriales bacterium]
MMRLITLMSMIVLAGTLVVPAQNGFIVHLDSAQGGKPGGGLSVFETADGYLVFTQQISHDGSGKTHIFVRKLDLQGQFMHEREYSFGDPRHINLGVTSPVCRLDTGGLASVVLEGSDFWAHSYLYRFNDEGDTTERKFLFTFEPQDSVTHFLRQTRQTSNGGYCAAGFYDLPEAKTKAFLVLLNSEGDTIWTRTYGQVNRSTSAYSCAEILSDGYLLVGVSYGLGVNDEQFLIRTDTMGNLLWWRQFGEDATGVFAVRMASDSTIITAGEYREDNWPNYWQQAMFTKWNVQGDIVWQKRSHYNYLTGAYDMEVQEDGSVIACIRVGPAITHIAKFSSLGDSLWSRGYTVFIDTHQPRDISLTSDGGFLSTGFVYQDNSGGHPGLQTAYVIKTDSLGCVVPGCHLVGVQEYEVSLQERLRLWPNPATDHVRLELELPPGYRPTGAVQAVLLDASGREVLRETVPLNGTTLSHLLPLTPFAPGLYHLHLADGKRWLAGGDVVVTPP